MSMITPGEIRRRQKLLAKPDRYCTKCDTEIRAPAWKWIVGLTVTAVIALIVWQFGWLIIIPFGPIGNLLDAGLRKWRQADYQRGYKAGLVESNNRSIHQP